MPDDRSPTRRPRPRRSLALVAVAVFAATLTPATPAVATATPAGLVWGACPPPAEGSGGDTRQQCATLQLPLDYRHPHGRQIDVTISRIATAEPGLRRGILLSNPGGPGDFGLDMPSFLAAALPAEVLTRYDLIGFDPRGVGASTPITCGITDPVAVTDLILPYPAPDGSIARNIEFARTTARDCAAHSGELLPHITTANTARDMDRIRAALGEPKLSYLGYSYGTYLGAVYTSLFPDRSDRIILDSAVDPNRIWNGVFRQWSPSVALRFPDFTGWAAARNDEYGLGATPAAMAETYFATAAALDREPLVTPGIVVTGNVYRQITRVLLDDDRNFPLLAAFWQALAQASPPAALPALRRAAPTAQIPADNGAAVLYAIVCGDVAWSRDVDRYARNVAVDRRLFPITAGMPANLWPCAFWPNRPLEPPVAVTGKGPRNVLILQNLRDPVTGWPGAFGLRRALDRRATMVTQDAGGHGVFPIRSGRCAADIATAFLTTGTLPDRDRFCPGPSPDDIAVTSAARPIPSGPLAVR
ncbi:alpha/beta hydrolase [Micromonospora sp. KC606]|uniref:alpha/beta hydrolase n=1 Tax=Micromonospora sp. KC606 TaxID=2530379 RepID=UPI001049CB41|nr:alpha/beta hydrolase [Micromonospora sp. KC606]TDC86190.1 alpha/beta hydrolase [Micromonospora sp. KC606]